MVENVESDNGRVGMGSRLIGNSILAIIIALLLWVGSSVQTNSVEVRVLQTQIHELGLDVQELKNDNKEMREKLTNLRVNTNSNH